MGLLGLGGGMSSTDCRSSLICVIAGTMVWDMAWRELGRVLSSAQVRSTDAFFSVREVKELSWLVCTTPASSLNVSTVWRDRWSGGNLLLPSRRFVDDKLEESRPDMLVLITHQEMSSVRGWFYWGQKLLQLCSEDQTPAQPSNVQISKLVQLRELGQCNSPQRGDTAWDNLGQCGCLCLWDVFRRGVCVCKTRLTVLLKALVLSVLSFLIGPVQDGVGVDHRLNKDGWHDSSSKVKPNNLYRPLVAGCSMFHELCLFHVSGCEMDQRKMSTYTSNIFL